MPLSRARTLWDLYDDGLLSLSVSCQKCPWSKNYPMDRLIEAYGKRYRLIGVLVDLTHECPKRHRNPAKDSCGARFVE